MTQTTAPAATSEPPFPQEPLREPSGTAMALLGHEGVLAVSGPDAARFLQGQVSCDVNALALNASTLGARCNPKGRMQSSFRLLRSGELDYQLAMSAELVERQRLELAKYAVFFKARLSDDSMRWARVGLWGDGSADALEGAGFTAPVELNSATPHPAGFAIRIAEQTYEIWLEREVAGPLIAQLGRGAAFAAAEDWRLQQIRCGLGQITAQTYESFIPQMLNLQQLGGVSFRKGCYTGQEIVARMQYLGTLKRRMFRLLMSADTLPLPGSQIVDRDTGRNVGEVVLAARSRNGLEMLAVLQKDAAQSVLSLADINGPSLTLADLPYESDLAAQEAAGDQPSRE